jgi:5-methylcytosine-specific restriction protein B
MSEMEIDQDALTGMIDHFRRTFPDFENFQSETGRYHDGEREYKDAFRSVFLKTVAPLLESDLIEREGPAREILLAFLSALTAKAGKFETVQNLVSWRGHDHLGKLTGDAAVGAARALQTLWQDQRPHDVAIESFADSYTDAFKRADTSSGVNGIVAVLGSLMLALKDPGGAIIVRKQLWSAVGKALLHRILFHNQPVRASEYVEALQVAEAVFNRFDAEGLQPRDFWDVHNFFWVTASGSYPDADVGGVVKVGLQSQFTREAIEAAMDAFDAYQETGQHNDIFDSFGSPRDFWVRSTRDRATRVYPSKPIVGFIQRNTNINGGWATATDAAARLYNAGYIIVDRDDQPVAPPERYEHLPRDADRVRMCARNYWIEPARERRENAISIRAGTIAQDVLLSDRLPNVCQALRGSKLQKDAGLAAPRLTEGVDGSTTAVFTFSLEGESSVAGNSERVEQSRRQATNMILYGPPGTGKTYHTAEEAVRLCDGTAPTDRNGLMQRYEELLGEGRIEFVTFHQSFSYEEFVEGLRPYTGDPGEEDAGEASSAGFSLTPTDGVFKRISERARLDQGESGEGRLDRSRAIFKVTLGQRDVQEAQIQRALNANQISIGWGGAIDWSAEQFDDFDAIHRHWKAEQGAEVSGHDGNVVVTWSFRAAMQIGDYVVISDGRDRIRAFGRVASDYFYDIEADYHPHRRNVEWIWRSDAGVERSKFYPNGFRRHAAYKLKMSLVDWNALEEVVLGEDKGEPLVDARSHVLIIDEINRANVSKVFGELITLLEPDKRLGATNAISLRLPYSRQTFGVPGNLHLIGTMNTADRSIALLDTALRRRFDFREILPRPDLLSADVDGINLRSLLTKLNERIEYLFDRDHQIGHAYFINCQSRVQVDAVMRDKVIPLLAEYFYEDWGRIRQVLGEENDDGRFISRQPLSPPPGLDAYGVEETRYRYVVRPEFAQDAYSGLA